MYIDDILILTKEVCTDQVQKSELNTNKLKGKGIQFNIEMAFFGQTKTEYLGFWKARDGVKHIDFKKLRK